MKNQQTLDKRQYVHITLGYVYKLTTIGSSHLRRYNWSQVNVNYLNILLITEGKGLTKIIKLEVMNNPGEQLHRSLVLIIKQ